MVKKRDYFAAANTACGFVSYYGDVFSDIDRVYVIKGGSGTGKSRFMKDVAAAAEQNCSCELVERFHCSFDPDSLDGIIINGTLAIIDGTAPHVYEPTLAGAKENLVDLGAFWDADTLRAHRAELSALAKQKKACFARGYGYLSAYGELQKIKEVLITPYIDMNAFSAEASKLVSELDDGERGSERLRIISAFGKDGLTSLDTYKIAVKKLIELPRLGGVGYMFIERLADEARRFGHSLDVSYDPLFKERPNALLVGGELAVVLTDGKTDEKYLCDEASIKGKASSISKLQNELLSLAENELKEASRIHFGIEEIYISAMDFGAKEEYTRHFIEKLKL